MAEKWEDKRDKQKKNAQTQRKQTNRWSNVLTDAPHPSSKRQFKQQQQLRQRQRRLEKRLYFQRISRELRFIQFVYHCQKYPKHNMQGSVQIRKREFTNWPRKYTFSQICMMWLFHVVVLQWTAMKWTKNYNVRLHSHCTRFRFHCGLLFTLPKPNKRQNKNSQAST